MVQVESTNRKDLKERFKMFSSVYMDRNDVHYCYCKYFGRDNEVHLLSAAGQLQALKVLIGDVG